VAERPADLRIEALARTHQRAAFNSGAEELDRYFKDQAGQDVRRQVAAVFVAVAAGRVVGYYTLSAAAIGLTDLPEDLARRLPRYPQIPATLLGRLAVDLSWQRTGLGERLLVGALSRSLRSEIASYAVVVDARDENAARFYRRYGFQPLTPSGRRLFLPMTTVARLTQF
jgi:predicted N-acetyltransferase YhbS